MQDGLNHTPIDTPARQRTLDQATRILREQFGYSNFRHRQAEIISALCAGRDVFTLMPTGGGKSLCYQIPALIRPGTAVVVSPLIALMQDQVDALHQLGIAAAQLNSALDPSARREVEQALRRGELDLLYVAPERLLSQSMLDLLRSVRIALFAIDEAHCVSQWGHDFRPEYQQLRVLHQYWPEVPRIALTATADAITRREIVDQLDLAEAEVFVSSFDRPNIRYTISDGGNGQRRLWDFIRDRHSQHAGIVYCLSRKRVEETARWLSEQGRVALPYHAGLPEDQRRSHQQRFVREEGVIICATIAFGMGIDKPDVRFVAHLNLPRNIEAYYQETGRAGRDGESADAWLAYGLQDVITHRQMLEDGEGSDQFKQVARGKLEAMLSLCEQTGCRRQTLLGYFGEQLQQPCGNCDNCLAPPRSWDATEAARKALSCVWRSDQRFGVKYVIDLLLGSEDDPRIRRFGHHQLSTFGIGKELKRDQWNLLFRQLLAGGYLTTEGEYNALRLTEKCRPLLRGEESLRLRAQQPKAARSKRRDRSDASTASRTGEQPLLTFEQPLFEALRALRLELARAQAVPPYVIFHDSTLREMTRRLPQSLQQLGEISGVGAGKLERFGSRFLQCIHQFPRHPALKHPLSDPAREALALHLDGLSVEQIAEQHGQHAAEIRARLSEAIAARLIAWDEVLALEPATAAEIRAAIQRLDSCQSRAIQPLYEALAQRFDYGTLRCMLADSCR